MFCLGEKVTAKVFEELSDSEVKRITRSMMSMKHVPPDVAESVLDDFKESRQKYAGIFVEGRGFVEKSLAGLEDKQQRFEKLLEQLDSGSESRALETIANMQAKMVAMLLEPEHPQTLALILSTQKVEHVGKILSCFPLELKTDAMYRMAKLEHVSPEIIAQIESVLQREIGVAVGSNRQHVGGIEKVAEILSSMEKGVDRNILVQMEDLDPELTETIRRKLFTFEDLIAVDDRTMQAILKEINTDNLSLSLKTASDELKSKIFNNISIRAAEMIQEDMEVMGPKRLSEVELVQQEIVKIALRLEDEGTVVLPGRGGRDVLV